MDVEEVCVPADRSCVPRAGGKGEAIELGHRPTHVALGDNQLAIASDPEDGGGGDVFIVPVQDPEASPVPSGSPAESPTAPPPTGESPGSSSPTPAAAPDGAISIATGVHVIGDVAYSEDGAWLAFSAAPADRSTGPDLYLWSVGDPEATVVTDDHQTYFASWHDGRILASRVDLAAEPADPDSSAAPGASAEPDSSAKPGRGNSDDNRQGGGKPRATEAPPTPSPQPTSDPSQSGSPAESAAPAITGHPISFLLDPETLERTDLTRPDVWLPVLDPSGRHVVYWSGTLLSTDNARTWALGLGELVLDRWLSGTPAESEGAHASPDAALARIGPAGQLTRLVPGAKATFEAAFDPDGERIAIWYSEGLEEEVGRLHLLVIDPATGAIDDASPLEGAAALRRFTLEKGRIAWVTPSGQNGQESLVQVLGWKGDDFGEIETEPASDVYLP